MADKSTNLLNMKITADGQNIEQITSKENITLAKRSGLTVCYLDNLGRVNLRGAIQGCASPTDNAFILKGFPQEYRVLTGGEFVRIKNTVESVGVVFDIPYVKITTTRTQLNNVDSIEWVVANIPYKVFSVKDGSETEHMAMILEEEYINIFLK